MNEMSVRRGRWSVSSTHLTVAVDSFGVMKGKTKGQLRAGSDCRFEDRIRVELLSDPTTTEWDEYVCAHREGTFFHLAGWRDSVASVFGHRPYYFAAWRGARIVGALPLFEVRSLLAGRMLVSVPYGVGGGILADDAEVVEALVREAQKLADSLRVRVIDLRSTSAVVSDWPLVDRYVRFVRKLPDKPEGVLDWLPRKARAAARNGRKKFGLEVRYGDEYLCEVWRLYALSMRRLGSINYPFAFFERLVTNAPDTHLTSLVMWRGKPVAGLLSFFFRDSVMPYFIGTSDEATACSAPNFIYMTLMERAVAEGYCMFDFGRSRADNVGSCNFKKFHGFEPVPLAYQYFVPEGQASLNLTPSNGKFALARRLWTKLPLVMTKRLGEVLSKHIPG